MQSKIPRQRENPVSSKQVRQEKANNPQNFDTETIVWRFSLLDHQGPFGWDNINPEKAWNIVKSKFKDLESFTWNDLKTKGKSHNVSKGQMIKDAQKRLEQIKQNDIDELFSLRIDGKTRIWGIRDRYVLKILWWDPEHKVCPSIKKHT